MSNFALFKEKLMSNFFLIFTYNQGNIFLILPITQGVGGGAHAYLVSIGRCHSTRVLPVGSLYMFSLAGKYFERGQANTLHLFLQFCC